MKDINPGSPGSLSTDPRLVEVAGTLFFLADDDTHGAELWRSDGTEAGTFLVKDINSGSFDSIANVFTAVDGCLFFRADNGIHGFELWRSDGTEEGTVLVQDIASGPESSFPAKFTLVGSRVFFMADDGVHGFEPWIGRAAILANRPQRAMQDLRDELAALVLPQGIERSLTAKLDVALEALAGPAPCHPRPGRLHEGNRGTNSEEDPGGVR